MQTGSLDIAGGLDNVLTIYSGRATTNVNRVQTIESVLVALMVVGAFCYYIFLVSPYVGALQQVGLIGWRLPWGRATLKSKEPVSDASPGSCGSCTLLLKPPNIMCVCMQMLSPALSSPALVLTQIDTCSSSPGSCTNLPCASSADGLLQTPADALC